MVCKYRYFYQILFAHLCHNFSNMIKVIPSPSARIGYTTSIMTHKRWIILKKCPFSFYQLNNKIDTLSVQLYSGVYTLHGCVSHPSNVCASRFSGFQTGYKIVHVEKFFS